MERHDAPAPQGSASSRGSYEGSIVARRRGNSEPAKTAASLDRRQSLQIGLDLESHGRVDQGDLLSMEHEVDSEMAALRAEVLRLREEVRCLRSQLVRGYSKN
jgi:hypothetical protein